MNLIIGLPAFIGFVVILIFLFKTPMDGFLNNKSDINPEPVSISYYQTYINLESKIAQDDFVDEAEIYMRRNNYCQAYFRFFKVLISMYYLRVNPTHERAKIGLTRLLINLCKKDNYYCDIVNQNIDFLIEEKYLSEAEFYSLSE